ncbi:MAG TPA: nuclear transport factor 2 family protein [Gammaproteobacteria bacterium]|nr:nuclear transport factor 2 family protein [Gammaproteobacteria bacterium]
MKLRMGLLAFAAVVSSAAVFAQEPVVGKADESLFTDKDPALHINKQATLHIMKELLQCGQWERSGEWLTDAYHQHNPNAATGRAAVVQFFTQVMKQPRTASCDKLTGQIVAVTAQGDLVTVLVPRRYKDPRDPTKCYSTTWFDTWRFVNGKADEHWDPATIAPPPSPEACPPGQ